MVIDRLHLCKCMKLRYSSQKKRPLPFDRVHRDSKWQKLFSRGHYNDYWFIYLWGSFVETISLFTGRRKRRRGRVRVGVRFMGRVVHSSQILAFHLTKTKVLNPPPNIDIPTWLFYCRTHRGRLPVPRRLPGIVWISTS